MNAHPDKFLRNWYLCNALYECVFAYAIYTALFSMRGLSLFQISVLLSWWALTSMVLEVPTGALADSMSRPRLLTIAPLTKALCFVVWAMAGGSFYLYALGFLLWSLGSSLASGTVESWLYDTLTSRGRGGDYEKIRGRTTCYETVAMGVAMVCGGMLAHYRAEAAVLLSVAPLLGSAFFASRLPEAPRSLSSGERVSYVGHIRAAVTEVGLNRPLLYLVTYLLGIGVMGNLEEFDQLYYELARLPLYAFGVAGLGWSLMLAAGASVAHLLKGRSAVVYMAPAAMALGLVLVSRYPSVPMIGLLLCCYLPAMPLQVLTESNLQRTIRTGSRATVTSAVALVTNLGAVVLPLLCGIIGRRWDLQAVYLATGIFLLVLAVWAYCCRRHLRLGPLRQDDL